MGTQVAYSCCGNVPLVLAGCVQEAQARKVIKQFTVRHVWTYCGCAVRQWAAKAEHRGAAGDGIADVASPAGFAEIVLAASGAHVLQIELIEAYLACCLCVHHQGQHCKQQIHAAMTFHMIPVTCRSSMKDAAF